VAETIQAGIGKARKAIESGAAKAKLEELVKMSKSLAA
jgi:anthranilate phosphoribosyltransferase